MCHVNGCEWEEEKKDEEEERTKDVRSRSCLYQDHPTRCHIDGSEREEEKEEE